MTAGTDAWSTGPTASLTITNTSTTPINGRQLGFTLPAGQTITNGWGATHPPASGAVTATDASYDAALAPGASVSIGHRANHTGDSAPPAAFSLNGAACTVGWRARARAAVGGVPPATAPPVARRTPDVISLGP